MMILKSTRGTVSSGGFDRLAARYIKSVEAANVSVTQTQKNAINSFILAEKKAGRWSSYRRIFLPVWGVASANAIDIITNLSGTFNGSWTHSSGFMKGDGSSGFFNTGISNAGAGMTLNGGSLSVLVYTADTRTDSREFIGTSDSINRRGSILQTSSTVVSSQFYNAAAVVSLNPTVRTGIFTGTVLSSTSRYIQRRSQAGIEYTERTTSDTNTASVSNTYIGARNANETAVFHTNAAIGAAVMSLGFSNTANEAFTLNLKTLWETCTGLTLP